jgi:hypothetical protein
VQRAQDALAVGAGRAASVRWCADATLLRRAKTRSRRLARGKPVEDGIEQRQSSLVAIEQRALAHHTQQFEIGQDRARHELTNIKRADRSARLTSKVGPASSKFLTASAALRCIAVGKVLKHGHRPSNSTMDSKPSRYSQPISWL